MTISSTTNRVSYTGNAVTTDFAFPYKFLANADLKVYLDGVLKTITTHYTLTGAGDDSGGTVTFLAAPANLEEVVILRDPAITQGLDLVENDTLPAESVEDSLDKLTMIAQRLNDRVDRSFVLSDAAIASADLTIPVPVADEVLKWNATGDALVSATIADIGAVSLPVSVSEGGTGSTSAATARTALGLAIGTDVQAYDADIPTVSASQAEMEAGTEAALRSMSPLRIRQAIAVNNFTEDATPDTANDFALVWDASESANKKVKLNKIGGSIASGAVIAATSGTSHDFTGIPSGVKKITFALQGVSTNGTSDIVLQLGDSGGIENTGYNGATARINNGSSPTTASSSAAFVLCSLVAATDIISGAVELVLLDAATNLWAMHGSISRTDAAVILVCSGHKALSATLDRVRLTTAGGANTFDAGSVNIVYQ